MYWGKAGKPGKIEKFEKKKKEKTKTKVKTKTYPPFAARGGRKGTLCAYGFVPGSQGRPPSTHIRPPKCPYAPPGSSRVALQGRRLQGRFVPSLYGRCIGISPRGGSRVALQGSTVRGFYGHLYGHFALG